MREETGLRNEHSLFFLEFSQSRVSSLRVASDHERDPSFLKSELALILQLSSPVLLVVSLMFLIGKGSLTNI